MFPNPISNPADSLLSRLLCLSLETGDSFSQLPSGWTGLIPCSTYRWAAAAWDGTTAPGCTPCAKLSVPCKLSHPFAQLRECARCGGMPLKTEIVSTKLIEALVCIHSLGVMHCNGYISSLFLASIIMGKFPTIEVNNNSELVSVYR